MNLAGSQARCKQFLTISRGATDRCAMKVTTASHLVLDFQQNLCKEGNLLCAAVSNWSRFFFPGLIGVASSFFGDGNWCRRRGYLVKFRAFAVRTGFKLLLEPGRGPSSGGERGCTTGIEAWRRFGELSHGTRGPLFQAPSFRCVYVWLPDQGHPRV